MSILRKARALIGCLIVMMAAATQAAEVNVISDRTDFHLKPIFKQFEAQTGIKVNAVFVDEGGIPARLTAKPGEADIIITTDASVLSLAKKNGWTQNLPGSKLTSSVRPELKDADYVALSFRSRTIVYNPEKVDVAKLTGYDDLASPAYKGRVSMRPLTHAYNVALVAEMISDRGEAYARNWVKGVANNLAIKPTGNDRKQGELVANGTCDISLMNTYYYGLMLSNNAQRPFAAKTRLFFPEQAGKGSYVLISGAAAVKGSKNSKEGQQLVDFILSPIGQNFVSQVNFEYPVIDDGEPLPVMVQGFGEGQPGIKAGRAKFNFVHSEDIAKNRELAVGILTEASK
jgi:iron(III) transport system substrate-binding protein